MIVPLAMKHFARKQICALSDGLAADLNSASEKMDVEGVHRIRVSIRRFIQSLKVFDQYVPRRASKKTRKQLRQLMRLSSKVRDLDVAVRYLEKHRAPSGDLEDRRAQARVDLADALKSSVQSGKWRSRLKLESL
jgi:CHAD domain-containing protein